MHLKLTSENAKIAEIKHIVGDENRLTKRVAAFPTFSWKIEHRFGIMHSGTMDSGGTMGLFDRALNVLKGNEEKGPARRPGRNDVCWCGSGKKYKRCHLPEDEMKASKACSTNCGPT